ncbi:MAG: GTP cyclohydrolase I FolE [Acidobacteriota bacterium]
MSKPVRPAQPTQQRPDRQAVCEAVRTLLAWVGEEPSRAELVRTPERVADAWVDLTDRGRTDLEELLAGSVFCEEGAGLVLVRDIEFYSLCEHHLLPFFGRCHVAYLPSGRIIGLSKIPRLVDHFARRLQVQERLTRQVAEAVTAAIQPQGVGCIIEASHLCMAMRGVAKERAVATTTSWAGVFATDRDRRAELSGLLRTGSSIGI